MDIKDAIEAEKAYIEAKIAGQAVPPLSEVVGYDDIEQYFADKKDYLLGSIDYAVFDGTVRGVPSHAADAVRAKQPTLYIPYADHKFLWHGSEAHDYETVRDYDVVDMGYNGGSIVSGPEDMSFAVIIPEAFDFGRTDFLTKLADFLGGVMDNNDVMIDGLKVAGSISYQRNGMFFFAAQVAFADHTEEIARICHKDSGKAVGYVKTRTKEELTAEVKSWLRL